MKRILYAATALVVCPGVFAHAQPAQVPAIASDTPNDAF